MDIRSQRLWQRGMLHSRQGNLAPAQASFEALLAVNPASVAARIGLAQLQARQGRFFAATRLARDAQALAPEQVEVLTLLARCLLMSGEPEAARALATQALALPRENAVVLDALGALMTRLDEQALAIELFDRAIALQPENASLHFNRALAQKEFGLLAGAERDLERCLQSRPGHGKAHWTLAQMLPRGPVDNHVARLREQLELAPAGGAQEEMLSLALFKELDDLGRHDEAWPALERGFGSRRGRWSAVGHDPRAATDALLRTCDEEFPIAGAGRGTNPPVFVIGMPGAGVALLGKLLSRHSKLHHLGVQQAFSRHLSAAIGRDSIAAFDAAAYEQCAGVDFEALGKRYLQAVTPAGSKQLLVCESRPMNFQLAAFIARALPAARFLHVTRDPIDNCLSILAHPGGESSLPGHDPARLASSYLDYRRLMLHWDRLLQGRTMEVSYESLVERPEMILRVVCSFLGIRYGSALRTGLMLHSRGIGRGRRYLARLPALAALE